MVANETGNRPFFTIAVPTYNRHDLLRETLQSVLSQSFGDFEIIVGNDYQAETLTVEMLGIIDPRVRIINHSVNLREVGNMNALLALARGRYFTWLFDDDLYEPEFLSTAHTFISRYDFPPALFSSFSLLRGSNTFSPKTVHVRSFQQYSGQSFLKTYFKGRAKIISTAGLFDTAALRIKTGGVEELCDSAVGVYCEYLFLVRCALLGRILFIDAPFVVMRTHNESWSQSNLHLQKFKDAGLPLIRRCAEVFRNPALVEDFKTNLSGICKLHLYSFAYKSSKHEIGEYRFGVAATARAISHLFDENTAVKSLFSEETGGGRFSTEVRFLWLLGKFSSLIIVWFIVFWIRQFFPGFLQLRRSFTPK